MLETLNHKQLQDLSYYTFSAMIIVAAWSRNTSYGILAVIGI